MGACEGSTTRLRSRRHRAVPTPSSDLAPEGPARSRDRQGHSAGDPSGATTIHEALELAFSDLATDTLCVLSDGEPAGGKIEDPVLIRDHGPLPNIGRGGKIHAVAIAVDLPIPRWLAQDSGGKDAYLP